MVFSSFLFLWFFLPIVFVAAMIFRKPEQQNVVLLLASLLFYAWGEPVYVVLLLLSILFNWGMGCAIGARAAGAVKKLLLAVAVAGNLSLLGYYKYADFISHTLGRLFPSLGIPRMEVALPIGISFFTFQSLAYIIDLYREHYPAQKNPLRLALYISFFPQLIAGPIVRYIDIEKQLGERTITQEKLASGIRRFLYGLGKKVLVANTMADITDTLLGLGPASLGTGGSWLAAIAYTLQIYYDFSGYSDMAIGLGRIFGFEFLENFNYPYLSRSIAEFWRRWHISLGTWFREYLYIPLGGNRKGKLRTYLNLFLVFAATGLWHGASWRFVIWGLFHGFFSIIERLGFSEFLKKHPIFARVYTILVFVLGWVIFRADDMSAALVQLQHMLIPIYPDAGIARLGVYIGWRHIVILLLAVLGCGPLQQFFAAEKREALGKRWKGSIVELLYCAVLAAICLVTLAGSIYNPFIYFRF